MNPRLRRLAADWEQVKKDFASHKHIVVKPVSGDPPDIYHVTYFVNGIYLLPDGRIETLGQHEVEITLHSDYPRYKPICKINTPIWHPNFRDKEVCIGDIWGAGESLSDIIVNIGDMIQYKSWNSYSPLSFEAAQWAIENKHIFPVGTVDLYTPDYASAAQNVSIDVIDANVEVPSSEPVIPNETTTTNSAENLKQPAITQPAIERETNANDFDITADELVGIEFVPSVNRTQTASQSNLVKGNKVNFKTILTKGILWAIIGSVVGYGLTENIFEQIFWKLSESEIETWLPIQSGIWTLLFALCLGLFLGIGEGVFYGSKENAIRYGLIGASVSLLFGFASGYISQLIYTSMLKDATSEDIMSFNGSIIRGLAWSIDGLSVGISVGLIRPERRRMLFCALGGIIGGFLGGYIFNFVSGIFVFGVDDSGTFPRFVGTVVWGLLIGLGIGLLEQFAKQAWLKVVRGDFEGKEYLVFAGTTSIGNNGKNTIVLFKDKLVGPHHCDIVQEGSRYVLVDQGTTIGTIVNGVRTTRRVLQKGDAIAVGNSVLVFNTK